MKFGLDEYAHLDSPLHRWEPRSKLVALLVLIFAFAFVKALWLLPPMIIITAVLYGISRIPLSYLRQRLKFPGYFIGALVLLLPFVGGQTVILELGPLSIKQEGVETAVLVAVRFTCIITVSLLLFGTSPFLKTIKAMRSLGLPEIMTDMVLLTYRYLFEIGDYLNRMGTAIRLRGFRHGGRTMAQVTTMTALIGNLLVRSYEQSERVYHAMVLRGYGATPPAKNEFQTKQPDIFRLAFVIIVAVCFVGAQIYLDTTL